MNIYTKLTLLCLFLVFFTSFTLLYFTKIEAAKVLEATIADKLLLQANKSIGSIDRFLYERLHDIRFMATDPVLRHPKSSPQQIQARLCELKALDQMSESLSFFDNQRLRIADTEDLDISKQHTLSKYWTKLAHSDLAFDVSKSESLKRVVLHFAIHVKDTAGNKIGTLVSRVLIDRLYEVFEISEQMLHYQGVMVDLLDAENVLLYSNHNIDLLKKVPFEVRHHKTAAIFESQDTLRLLAAQEGYMDFKGENWVLMMSIPKKVAFRSQQDLAEKILYTIIPIITIAIFLTLFVAKRFSRPIRELSQAAIEIGAGNLNTPITINKRDEIGLLAKNFKKMALNLQLKLNELNETNLRLHQLNLKMEEKYHKIIRQKQKIETQKQQIEQQNNLLNEAFKEIEHKNKAITSSILYAERIQVAILPKKEVLLEHFPQSFILDMPKDIVSGDFYWFDEIVFGQEHYFVVAVADCTGHGVPGGFMSILGSNLFTSIIDGEIVQKPSEILLALNRGIKRALHQEEYAEKNQDGMDVALCVIHKEQQELCFVGAHRPLYKFSDGEFFEFKGEKYSMGGVNLRLHKNKETLAELKENRMPIRKGDRFYLFSDGFKDQMGKKDGRLYSSRRFKEFLFEIQDYEIEAHEALLQAELEKWKGENKQTDDVLILGFEIA